MADHDDEPTKRESHFNEQRASLRSDTSQSPSSASHTQSPPSASHTQTPPSARSRSRHHSLLSQRRRLPRTADSDLDPDRADSETLPLPSQPRTRATSRGRTIDDLLVAPSRDHLDAPSSPPPHITALPTMTDDALRHLSEAERYRQPADASHLSGAERYHRSQASPQAQRMSRLWTEVYTLGFLVFFAIWGSLARLGLQALTFYPGAPVTFSELWANVAGTFVMGFLAEDMRLFREEWGSVGGGAELAQPRDRPAEGHQHLEKQRVVDKKSHGKVKKTIPLYVGLTTGFCGSLTSFSSFLRDVFLGLSNELPAPVYHPSSPADRSSSSPATLVHRDAGYSVMALLGVVFVTVALCLCALKAGAHLAASLDHVTPTLPFRLTRRVIDPAFVVLGAASWIGAVAMAALPPHDAWRGQALFACVFAPVGCLMRYYLSLALNAKVPSFPLGTFACNLFGTAVLGMAFDLQRVAIGGVAGGSVVGCQILQGIQDGFCGALTTVSTWMLELDTLRRGHAYLYGTSSVVAGLSIMTVIMGSVRWSVGWEAVACVT